MERLLLNANRNGYAPDQCGRTMTVGGGWWQFGRKTLKAWRSSDSGL